MAMTGRLPARPSVRPGRYDEQAATYDRTRGPSPQLVQALLEALGEAVGRWLLDVAAGTGNYTRELQRAGFDVVMADAEPAMLRRSVDKVGSGRQVVADAMHLPFPAAAFDTAVMTQALHLFVARARPFGEIRRVLRDGPFVLQAYTEENLAPSFVVEYFPEFAWDPAEHPPADRVEAMLREGGFGRVEHATYVYRDTTDANLQALHLDAVKLADPDHLRNTSFFQRLPEAAREAGLARLRADLASGRLAERVEWSRGVAERTGHGTVFVARP
jgi:ubiquinone/menaquinone biosynthesis C-methylase UbiE